MWNAAERWYNIVAMRAIDRLAEAIGYPERAPAGDVLQTLQIDGTEIVASESGGRLRLVCRLPDGGGASLPRFAAYAAGRMLREDATLSVEPETPQSSTGGAFLWQETAADAGGNALRRFLEDFCASCDWWRERAASGEGGDGGAPHFPEMAIRP